MVEQNNGNKHIETKILHSGFEQESNAAHNTPLYLSSSYIFKNSEEGAKRMTGRGNGYLYARYGTPNISEIEKKIADLETNGLNIKASAVLFSSGMSAIHALFLTNLNMGDTVLCSFPIYGGTYTLTESILKNYNINAIYIDFEDLNLVESHLQSNKSIKLIHIETPANPTLNILNIQKICDLAKKYSKKSSIDSTFATPYLQQPFKFGIDFIVHSCTKFINGHGTGVSGILIGKDIEFMETKVLQHQRILGSNSNSMDAFLLSIGIKTLAIRMDKQAENCLKIATYLESHPKINRVMYPGLKSHKGYVSIYYFIQNKDDIAKQQMRNAGAVMSFEVKGGYAAAEQFYNSMKLVIRAVSLGTVDTIACHPASTTHYFLNKKDRDAQFITEGLIRMSVGLENPDDIIKDLEQALNFSAKL